MEDGGLRRDAVFAIFDLQSSTLDLPAQSHGLGEGAVGSHVPNGKTSPTGPRQLFLHLKALASKLDGFDSLNDFAVRVCPVAPNQFVETYRESPFNLRLNQHFIFRRKLFHSS